MLHPRGYGAIPHAWAKGFLPNTEPTGNPNIGGTRILVHSGLHSGCNEATDDVDAPSVLVHKTISAAHRRMYSAYSANHTCILLSYPEQLTWHMSLQETSRLRYHVARRDQMKPFPTSCEGWVGQWKMTPSSFG